VQVCPWSPARAGEAPKPNALKRTSTRGSSRISEVSRARARPARHSRARPGRCQDLSGLPSKILTGEPGPGCVRSVRGPAFLSATGSSLELIPPGTLSLRGRGRAPGTGQGTPAGRRPRGRGLNDMDLVRQVSPFLSQVPSWGWAAGTFAALILGIMLGRITKSTGRPASRRPESDLGPLRDLKASVARLEAA